MLSNRHQLVITGVQRALGHRRLTVALIRVPGTLPPPSASPVTSPSSMTSPSSVTSPAPASSGTTAPAPRTRQIVLRPVTSAGRAAPGYTTAFDPPDEELNCGGSRPGAGPSPVAVDAGIVSCGPSAAYALACWNGSSATTALCYRDPWRREVTQIHTGGRLPAERASELPLPLGLELSDGTRCSLRDGGAWATLDVRHDMFGIYSCRNGMAVWASSSSDIIDRSRALWNVRLAPMSGHGELHTATVRTAYFVGTSRD